MSIPKNNSLSNAGRVPSRKPAFSTKKRLYLTEESEEVDNAGGSADKAGLYPNLRASVGEPGVGGNERATRYGSHRYVESIEGLEWNREGGQPRARLGEMLEVDWEADEKSLFEMGLKKRIDPLHVRQA